MYYKFYGMTKEGPIIIIEDDIDDQEIISDIFKKIGVSNEIVFFGEGTAALAYLNNSANKPFLILSDVNMPKMGGFELRKQIHTNEQLSRKCIPFLFFTTGAHKKAVFDAYSMSVQGYFQKPNSVKELEKTIRVIIEYWQECIAPSEYLS
jgi:CheY-like chemotaxis protein